MADERQTQRQQTYSMPAEEAAANARAGATGAGAATTAQATKSQLTWQHGIQQISTAHGAALTERARDLVRRALGELYQEAQGGAQASLVARDVAANIGNTDKLNKLGAEQHAQEFPGLNHQGSASD